MLTAGLCAAYREGVKTFSSITGVNVLAEVKADAQTNAWAGARLLSTDIATFLANESLMDEVFGPSTLIVQCASKEDLLAAARKLEGQLTATVHGTPEELAAHRALLKILEARAGRLVCNAFPTGVEVCHAMTHGGPYPATSDSRSTSVGTRAIERFTRQMCFQGFPDALLPQELQEANPLGIRRLVDGKRILP